MAQALSSTLAHQGLAVLSCKGTDRNVETSSSRCNVRHQYVGKVKKLHASQNCHYDTPRCSQKYSSSQAAQWQLRARLSSYGKQQEVDAKGSLKSSGFSHTRHSCRGAHHHTTTASSSSVASSTSPSAPISNSRGGELSSTSTGTSASSSSQPPDVHLNVNLGSFFKQIQLQRVALWAGVAFTAYQLRDFVGIMMGTFVLSMVGNTFITWAQKILPKRRRLLLVAMYSFVLAVLAVLGVIYLPKLVQEGVGIIQLIENEDPYTLLSGKLRAGLGEGVTDKLEKFVLMMVSKPDTVVLDMSQAGSQEQRSRALQQMLKKYSGQLVSYLTTLIAATSRFAVQSVISLIFSFMIVWDMPTIKKGVHSLRTSRLSLFYEELAPVAATFGRIFGKALQAQSFIAVSNTVLTALGMLALRMKSFGLLSLIVFICSFVPVAGVILSTAPIGIVAVSEGGLFKLGLVMAMVVGVHAVEAYILNPAIYSAHLDLHPILALAVIFVAEHTLGVWGLLVAVPLSVFIIEHVIKKAPMMIIDEPKAATA